MALRDRHTRIVGWLKVALPLMALAILSTLFLLSRRIEPPDQLPFAEVDMEERARRQQVTRPSLSGASENGDLIEISAAEVSPDAADPDLIEAREVTARIEMTDGGTMRIRADRAVFDRPAGRARLTGDVVIVTATGQEVRTERLDLALDRVDAVAPGEVRSTGPEGRLSAGGMRVGSDGGERDVQLVFTDGVKLVYDPNNFEDR